MSRKRLEKVLEEMVAVAEADLDLVAIAMAVTVPAICASLSMSGGRAQRKEYLLWCKNLYPDKGFDHISPGELYALRNGLLHEGRSRMINYDKRTERIAPAGPLDGVRFVTKFGLGFANCKLGNHYLYSVLDFCRNMQAAALEWLDAEAENQLVQENLEKLIAYHPFDSGFDWSAAGEDAPNFRSRVI